jgi:hypothetical protein
MVRVLMRPALARMALAMLSRLTDGEQVQVQVQVRGTLVTVPVAVGEVCTVAAAESGSA